MLLLILSLPVLSAADVISITDKLNRKVDISTPVNRVVFHINCELIPALDIRDKVVGVGKWCYENDVMKNEKLAVPVISRDTTDMNVEALFKIRPDIIVTWPGVRDEIGFLEKHGFKTIAFYPESLDELYEMLIVHGRMFGKEPRMSRAITEMKRLLDIIARRTAQLSPGKQKKGLWLGSAQNRVVCKHDLKNDLLGRAGMVNPAASLSVQHATVSTEKIVQWNPDIIFIPPAAYRTYSLRDMLNNPQWKHTKAVRERRVYEFPNKVTSWSPSFAPIALWMASKAYPERFRDVNIDKTIDRFYRKVYGIPYAKVTRIAN